MALQSFALPSLKVKPELSANLDAEVGDFGVPEIMKHGFAVSQSNSAAHPLVLSEKNVSCNFVF